MVAQMFDDSVDIATLIRAAREGRTLGSCSMRCDLADGQLRTVGDFLDSAADYVSSAISSVSNSISLG